MGAATRIRRALTVVAVLLVSLSAVASGPPSTGSLTDDLAAFLTADEGMDGSHLVHVHARSAADAEAASRATGLVVVDWWPEFDAVTAVGPESAVRAVALVHGVDLVENGLSRFDTDTSQRAIGADAAWTLRSAGQNVDGTGISIAIVDSGIDASHLSFQWPDGSGTKVARAVRNVCWTQERRVQDEAEPCWVDAPEGRGDLLSAEGHGTHVAGIAAGVELTLTDGTRLAGSAPGATLIDVGVSVGPQMGAGSNGLGWVLRHHPDPCGDGSCPPIRVVNGSYGSLGGSTYDPDSLVAQISEELTHRGVVVVRSAGNSGGDGSESTTNGTGMSPVPGILSVAAYDDLDASSRDGTVADFSSRGAKDEPATWPDISAPGVGTLASCSAVDRLCAVGPDGQFTHHSGTSMAAPHVAGVVALLLQARPSLTPADVERLLESTAHRFDGPDYVASRARADDTGPTSFDAGHGLVDAARAVARVLGEATPALAPRWTGTCTPDGGRNEDKRGDHGSSVWLFGYGHQLEEPTAFLAADHVDIVEVAAASSRAGLTWTMTTAAPQDGRAQVSFDLKPAGGGWFRLVESPRDPTGTTELRWNPPESNLASPSAEGREIQYTVSGEVITFSASPDDVAWMIDRSGSRSIEFLGAEINPQYGAPWGQDSAVLTCPIPLG